MLGISFRGAERKCNVNWKPSMVIETADRTAQIEKKKISRSLELGKITGISRFVSNRNNTNRELRFEPYLGMDASQLRERPVNNCVQACTKHICSPQTPFRRFLFPWFQSR